MKNQKLNRVAAVVSLFVAILGIAIPASAGDGVPFKGTAEAAIVNAVPDGDLLHVTVIGSGEATHLGRFTRVENLTLYPDGSIDGTLTFRAANGDLLIGDVLGGFTGPGTAAGTVTFTGGSGRFIDATGGYEWTGVTLDGAHFSIVFEGDISF